MVLDASFVLALVLDKTDDPAIQAAGQRIARDGAIVPLHWHVEVANSVISAERRRRISAEDVMLTFDDLRTFVVAVDGEGPARLWRETVVLAQSHRLTMYDAAYLELAMRRALPLASLDRELVAAARTSGVEVIAG